MTGYSGVLQRQLNDDSAARDFVMARLQQRDEKDEAVITAAAKVHLALLKRQRPKGKECDVRRAQNSFRTKKMKLHIVNEIPTKGRVQYALTGEATIMGKGQFDEMFEEVDIRKLQSQEREDLGRLFGIELDATTH